MIRSPGQKAFSAVNTLLMILLMLITAYPLYFVLIASFSDPTELMLNPGALLVPLQPLTLRAYEMVLGNPLIVSGYSNTLFIMVVGVVINLIMTITCAYTLSIRDLLLKNPVTFFIIFTMYFSGGLIPGYLNIRDLGLYDSLWALILPGALSTTNMIIMKTAFQAVPESLPESAKLDGASHFTLLLRIMTPLCVPTIAVMVLYYGVGHWNSWFSASIYLKTNSKFPLQLVMRNILNSVAVAEMAGSDMDETARLVDLIKYALIIIATVPILALYPFLQKYFVKGIMIGAIKG